MNHVASQVDGAMTPAHIGALIPWVDAFEVTNGSRLSTYVIPGVRGSGEVGINGAAAHLVSAGDLVILANYGWLTQEEAARVRPRIVFVDGKNRIVEAKHEEFAVVRAELLR